MKTPVESAKMFNLSQIKVCTEQLVGLLSYQPPRMKFTGLEKLNTFLRLVKTVLVAYLKTGHDSIICYSLLALCVL